MVCADGTWPRILDESCPEITPLGGLRWRRFALSNGNARSSFINNRTLLVADLQVPQGDGMQVVRPVGNCRREGPAYEVGGTFVVKVYTGDSLHATPMLKQPSGERHDAVRC